MKLNWSNNKTKEIINNGYLKQRFVSFYKQNKLVYWIVTIVLVILFSFLIMFTTAKGVVSADTKTVFRVYSITVVQIIVTGFCLGISGYLIQRITRNRLIDTSSLGIGNVCLIGLLGLGLTFNFDAKGSTIRFLDTLPFIFVFCSLVAGLCLYYFAKTRNNFSSNKLIVCGIFLNFISITIAISLRARLSLTAVNFLDDRLIASFGKRSDLEWILAGSLFSICLVWWLIRSFHYQIVLNEINVAKQLGLKVKLINFELIAIASILTAIAYILAGNILFLAIASGNIAYLIFGNKLRNGAFFSGLITSLFLLFSHFILNNIIGTLTPYLFHAPIMTPLIIAPIFLIIVLVKK
ncbi:iron ABC transporter permease [Ureaplasma diversum]|uniref:ABC transporter, permease protein n=1 Tax=Ureaplasma diversum NCTC 246 TaxID=1188241 RepID=A0A084F0M8_9BACT|nr:iron ABC transporter permease [Ureaplasma diversum]KEZ23770.1 ABC transporter, permease protein [Ureaplasma diversum NCTC 246]